MVIKLTVLFLVSGFPSIGFACFSNPTQAPTQPTQAPTQPTQPPTQTTQPPTQASKGFIHRSDAENIKSIVIQNQMRIKYPETGSWYPSNDNRLWILEIPSGKAARISFSSFSTEQGYDFVKFYDGHQLVREMSGQIRSPNSFSLSLRESAIHFYSDNSVTFSGFDFIIEEIPMDQHVALPPLDQYETTTAPGLVTETQQIRCVHDISISNTAEINYPGNGRSTYPNHANCAWTFVIENNKAAHIQFLSFRTEATYDRLKVYDGNALIMEISGYQSTVRNLTVVQPGSRITFSSDVNIRYSGFRIRIVEIEPSEYTRHPNWPWTTTTTTALPPSVCSPALGIAITSSPTTIVYPDDGHSFYPNNVNCGWEFQIQSGKAARIDFHSFETEQDYDFLKIYDGTTKIVQASGVQTPPGVTVIQQGSRITFVSDSSIQGLGFRFSVVEIDGSEHSRPPPLTPRPTTTRPPIMIPSNDAFPTNQLSSDFSSWGSGIWSRNGFSGTDDLVWGTYQGGTSTLLSGEIAAVALIAYKPRNSVKYATLQSIEYEGNQCLSLKLHMRASFVGLQVLSISTARQNERLIWQRDGLNSAYESRVSRELQQTVKIPIAGEGTFQILIRAKADGKRRVRMSNYVMISEINVTEGNCNIAEQLDSSDCGVKNSNSDRIYGGRNANPGEWPWMVRLIIQPDIRSIGFCGAALISERWIVTAAHCIGSALNASENLEMMFSDHNRRTTEENQFTIVPELVISPNKIGYDEVGGVNYRNVDIALIKLPFPLRLTNQLRPICLSSLVDVSIGQSTTWIGFGLDRYGGGQHILQEVELNVNRCSLNFRHLPQHEFCVYSNNKGVNRGDSGGPGAVLRNGIWYMVGLVSRGPSGDPNSFPSIMTSTSRNTAWINEVMSRHQ